MKLKQLLLAPAVLVILLTLSLAKVHAASTPIIYFPLNEGSGGDFRDTASGLMGRLGIYQSPATDRPLSQASSPSGQAGDRSVKMQGNGFVMVDDSNGPVLNMTNGPITLESWVNIDPNFARPNEGFAGYGNSYKLGLRGGFLVWTFLGIRDITNNMVPFPVDQWVHVAAAWEPGVGITFFVNGEANFVPTTLMARPVQNNYLSIGSEGTGNNVIAGFDRFRIHQAVLTRDDLDLDAQNAKAPLANTRVAYDFNETDFPFPSAVSPARPARPSLEVLPEFTGPAWVNDSPTGRPDDFALYFNGSRRASVPDPSRVIVTNAVNGDYTLESWVKLPVGVTPPARMILFQYESVPGFALSINANRTLHTTTFGKNDIVSSALVPNDGQWHHVAVVHQDGVEMRFYIDGVLLDTRAYTRGAGNRTSAIVTIGAAANGANPFTGTLDRLRYSNTALAPSELDFPAIPGFPRFLTQPASSTVFAGTNVTLSASTTGQAPLAHQWYFSASGRPSDAVAIPGATSSTLTLSNVQGTTQGIYTLSVSNGVGVASTLPARVLVATAPNFLTPLWSLAPGDRPYLTAGTGSGQTDNLERGMAYNPVTDHVLVLARATSPELKGIYILNAATGADLGTLRTNDLIAGGTFVLNKIGVADDGAIYAANFGTFSDVNPFRIYRWASETAEPTLAYSGNPASGVANQQWGKNMDVRGAGTNTQILLDSRTSFVAVLTTSNGTDFQSHLLGSDAPADAFSYGITFGEGNTFWGRNVASPLYQLTFNLTTSTAQVVRAQSVIADDLVGLDYSPTRQLLAGIDVRGTPPDHVNVYDISNLDRSPVLLDLRPYATTNLNRFAAGNTAFGRNRLFALDTNNGLRAFDLPEVAAAPRLTVARNGSNVVISWPSAATGFVLQSTTDLANPDWQAVPVSEQNGQFVATVPIGTGNRFFRLVR